MSAPIVFMDTETTGLLLTDDIWEFAAIRVNPDGSEEVMCLLIEHDPAKAAALPEPFRADHDARFRPEFATTRARAAERIVEILRPGEDGARAHVVGAVPNFDTERIEQLLAHHLEVGPNNQAPWHYHLIDVETLAVGYLAAKGMYASLPWDSDEISRALGVDPPGEGVRHTAMGDVRWARAVYDAITKMSAPGVYLGDFPAGAITQHIDASEVPDEVAAVPVVVPPRITGGEE